MIVREEPTEERRVVTGPDLPPSSLDAFAWEDAATKQVVVVTPKGHIHEAAWEEGDWTSRDLTDETGAPVGVAASLVAFEWRGRGVKQILYSSRYPIGSPEGSLHELWAPRGGKWRYANLSAATGGYAEFGVDGLIWTAAKSKQYFYTGRDGHIHEISSAGGDWSEGNLTARLGPPPWSYRLTAYEWQAGKTKQVAYERHGRIFELYVGVGGSWKRADLTQESGGLPDVSAAPIHGFDWIAGGSKQIVYLADGHVHELSAAKGMKWTSADLSARSGANVHPTSDQCHAFAWERGLSKHVVYTSKGNVHELSVVKGGKWTYMNLTKEKGAPAPADGTPIKGFEFAGAGSRSIVYIGHDLHLYEVSVNLDGTWEIVDVTAESGIPTPAF